MPLEPAPQWTDLYYDVVKHYFFRPQRIGRMTDPEKAGLGWAHWRGKLEEQEVPLNHMMDLLFHMAPQGLLDRVVSAFLGRSAVGGQLVSASADVVDVHIVQPDIIFSDGRALVFIEMKVDSRSSIDQFVKYAIAAHCICRDSPNIESVDLVMLSRDGTHLQLWKKAKTLGLTDTAAVRKVALRGLKEDMDVWGEAGVPSFLEKNPGVAAALSQQVSSMGLHLADYRSLQTTLQEYATEEKTVSRLIEGVLWEFARRGLT